MAKQVSSVGIGDAWATGLGQKTEKIKRGINNVSEAPGRKAAAQSGHWLAKVTAAEPLFKERVGAVTLEEWKDKTLAKVDRVSSGAQSAKADFEAKMGPVIAHLQSGLNKLDGMPRGDIERNLERSNVLARHMASFKRRG